MSQHMMVDCIALMNSKVTIGFNGNMEINFNPTTNEFELYNKYEMQLHGYSSIQITFEFECMVDQLLIFEQGKGLELLSFDLPPTRPNIHTFTEIIIHNLAKEAVSVPEKSLLGSLKIWSLRKHVIYRPMYASKIEFDKCANQQGLIKNHE